VSRPPTGTERLDVDEPVERAGDPPPVVAAIIPAERVADDIESGTVVPFEQPAAR
jgi:hypothetical protein